MQQNKRQRRASASPSWSWAVLLWQFALNRTASSAVASRFENAPRVRHNSTASTQQQTRRASLFHPNKDNFLQPRIVEGTRAPDGAYPYFVSSYQGTTLCGGTLIFKDIVLTAAHCQGAFHYGALIGQEVVKGNAMADVYYIDRQRPHPGYFQNHQVIADDVMVLRLSQPVTDIPFIKLNDDPDVPSDWQEVTAVGMGLTSADADETTDELLQTSSLLAFPTKKCRQALEDYDNVEPNDDLLCAGRAQEQSICQGDSGGPLLLIENDKYDKAIQIGITSFTDDCQAETVPNGFARLSTFYDWIQAQICDLSVDPPSDCPDKEPDNPQAVTIAVIIKHDASPHETVWAIRDMSDKTIVYAGPQLIAKQYQETSEQITLEPGDYRLELYDTFGDGLVSSLVTGSVMIRAVATETRPYSETLVEETNGVFKHRLRLRFRVPELDEVPPTMAPIVVTPSPTTTTPFPTDRQTLSPTVEPLSKFPTIAPTTEMPSLEPTSVPSWVPSALPSDTPSSIPSFLPSSFPTNTPSGSPTTASPTETASVIPTQAPTTPKPSDSPSRTTLPAGETPTPDPTQPQSSAQPTRPKLSAQDEPASSGTAQLGCWLGSLLLLCVILLVDS